MLVRFASKLSFQREHPWQARERGRCQGARCAHGAPQWEKGVHEGVHACGEDYARKCGIQRVERQGKLEARERVDEHGQGVPGRGIVAASVVVGQRARPIVQGRPVARVGEMASQSVVGLVVVAAIVRGGVVEPGYEDAQAHSRPRCYIQEQKTPLARWRRGKGAPLCQQPARRARRAENRTRERPSVDP